METNQQQTTIVVKSGKSMGLALVLTFFFGPLGMFYSTITGAIIMMILTPIVSLISLGFGLPIMWIIQMIWAGVAANNSNNANGTSVQVTNSSNATDQNLQATTPVQQISETPQATKYDFVHYEDANKLNDSQIEEMLSKEASELNEEFVKALKFVQNEREQMAKVSNERKNALSKALDLNEEERKNRISSPTLYSSVSISAITYIQRCSECDIEPNTTGFLATFEDGYIAPETPTERAEREKEEKEQEERERERKEKQKKKAEEAAKSAAEQKRTTIIVLSILAIIGVIIGVYTGLIKPNNEYNKTITMIDTRYENLNESATLEAKKRELENIANLYKGVEIPSSKNAERTQYISSQIAAIEQTIIPIEKEIARLAEEEKRIAAENAKVAKQKADEEAKQKAIESARKEAIEIRDLAASAAQLPPKVFTRTNYIDAGRPVNLILPYSVTSIGDNAVDQYGKEKRLKTVSIPNSVTSIGSSAFNHCSGLTAVKIPNSVTKIGNKAFSYCSGLTAIKIPNSVTRIGEEAFYGCSKLTKITISNSLARIEKRAFKNCPITTIDIPNSVLTIGLEAFWGCSITSVTIPNSVKSIGDGAFAICKKLKSVSIPNSVTNLGAGAFGQCESLTSVIIPNSVTSIKRSTFYGCHSLTSVTISNSVESIEKGAFENCIKLTSLTIPNSVTLLDKDFFDTTRKLTINISKSSPIYEEVKTMYQYNSNITIKTLN